MENITDVHHMEMLRAALPYIPVSMQKFLNIYIGFEELFHAIKIIKEGPILYMDEKDFKQNKLGNTEELVKVLRKFCSPKENEMIDFFFQMSDMMNMYDQYKDVFSMLLQSSSKPEQKNTQEVTQDSQQTLSSSMNPATIMNLVNQWKGSSELDDIFKEFSNQNNS